MYLARWWGYPGRYGEEEEGEEEEGLVLEYSSSWMVDPPPQPVCEMISQNSAFFLDRFPKL